MLLRLARKILMASFGFLAKILGLGIKLLNPKCMRNMLIYIRKMNDSKVNSFFEKSLLFIGSLIDKYLRFQSKPDTSHKRPFEPPAHVPHFEEQGIFFGFKDSKSNKCGGKPGGRRRRFLADSCIFCYANYANIYFIYHQFLISNPLLL